MLLAICNLIMVDTAYSHKDYEKTCHIFGIYKGRPMVLGTCFSVNFHQKHTRKMISESIDTPRELLYDLLAIKSSTAT